MIKYLDISTCCNFGTDKNTEEKFLHDIATVITTIKTNKENKNFYKD
jgi:hypothetical protein